MLDPVTGNPHTAHTTNPVPFITSFPLKQEGGCLADVAPTVLAVMVSPDPRWVELCNQAKN